MRVGRCLPDPTSVKAAGGLGIQLGTMGKARCAHVDVHLCLYSACMCAAMPSPPAPGGSARRNPTGRAAGPSGCSAPRCLLSHHHPPNTSGAGPGLAPGSRGREVLIFQWVFVRSESAPPAGLRAALPGLFITSLPGGSAAAPGLLPASRGGGGGGGGAGGRGVLRGGSRAATGPAGSPSVAVTGCAGGKWRGTVCGGAAGFQRAGAEMESEESAAESGSLWWSWRRRWLSALQCAVGGLRLLAPMGTSLLRVYMMHSLIFARGELQALRLCSLGLVRLSCDALAHTCSLAACCCF